MYEIAIRYGRVELHEFTRHHDLCWHNLVGIITEKDIVKAILNNRSLVCELQDRLPSGNDYLVERVREITFLDGLFPSGKVAA